MSAHTSFASNSSSQSLNFTNTAKLPIEIVKSLIKAVALRPNLWMRNHVGQKRCDVSLLWYEVSHEVQLPADICRIKWGHLRDNFRKVFIRNTLSNETPTTWRFYNDMRFMEKSVAENVLRQHRNKNPKQPWSDLSSNDQVSQDSKFSDDQLPLLKLAESHMDMSFQDQDYDPSKPIKQEPEITIKSDGEGFKDKSRFSDVFMPNNYPSFNQDYDDDDFDEDAATTDENDNENPEVRQAHKRKADDDILTIEVYDDEDNDGPSSSVRSRSSLNTERKEPKFDLSGKKMPDFFPCDKFKEESSPEQDSDRMFLLSLLPYLQRVDSQRKLNVRQKLQNVLIEEFG